MANGKTEVQVQTTTKKKSSIRKKMLLKKLVENGGKSVSKAMIEVGYAPATAKNPQKITKSKEWNELMDEYLPDSELMRVHKELINAAEINKFDFPPTERNSKIKETIESVAGCRLHHIHLYLSVKHAYYSSPDNLTRTKAIEAAYKLKNKYKGEDSTITHKFAKEDFDQIKLVLGA